MPCQLNHDDRQHPPTNPKRTAVANQQGCIYTTRHAVANLRVARTIVPAPANPFETTTCTPEAIGLPLDSFLCNAWRQGCLNGVDSCFLHTTVRVRSRKLSPQSTTTNTTSAPPKPYALFMIPASVLHPVDSYVNCSDQDWAGWARYGTPSTLSAAIPGCTSAKV